MLKDPKDQLNIYSILYNKIPKNHILKVIDSAIDFHHITELVASSYNKYYGRPAKNPLLMLKLSILQRLYNLSDERVIEEASLKLAYMWFLGINPDEDLPDPSLLSKFRVHRLKDITLDEIIVEIVKQCVEKGIIDDTGISIDTTHTHANTYKAVPERVMKHMVQNIFKSYKSEVGDLPEESNEEIPEYKEIKDHKEAKQVMKGYLEEEMKKIENTVSVANHPETHQELERAKEILQDPKFIEQRGVRSLIDQDARVGHKSKNENFFGFKTEIMMTTKSRIITGLTVGNGAYVDGTRFEELLDSTMKSGLDLRDVFGDKAYFRKMILDAIVKNGLTSYIPVSEMAYKIDEDRFAYNKDSDEWFCIQGNKSIKRKHRKDKSGKQTYKYYFEKELCRHCPNRPECIKRSSGVGKILEVGINTMEFYAQSQLQKSELFKEKYKERASLEWKNGELKNHHGLDRARGYGLKSMSTQAKLTAIAVNLKRIAGILSSKLTFQIEFFRYFCKFYADLRLIA